MKRIVFCSDGTWNRPDDEWTTNVWLTHQALLDEPGRQEKEYDPGVGTGGFVDRIVGGATGAGLSRNVQDCYRWLANAYEPGDEIFLFGYSRGAYTVRSAVGMIRKCGLLRREELHRMGEAYRIYRVRGDGPDSEAATRFRDAHSHTPRIRFLGVWDTVGALGLPGLLAPLTASRHRFHDTRLSSIVQEAYHAVAIDERRVNYQPPLWETKDVQGQRVEQTWFAGAHGNVGGGYDDPALSAIAFRWMRERAERAGLRFDADMVASFEDPADPLGRMHDKSKGFWQFLGLGWRAIGEAKHQPQDVHPTVRERWDAMPEYAPKNLVALWGPKPR